MTSPSPPRLVIRGIAVLGGLLALAAVGLAADRRGSAPLSTALSTSAALSAPEPSELSQLPAAPLASAPAIAVGPADALEPPAPSGVLPDGRVVLNLASEEEIQKLPGLGPSRARAIVELRKRRGKFRSLSELLRVKGIGRKTLAKLTHKVVLDPPPSSP
ncbi:MAG: helix-hairpin-helix domain-containing protein [Myxococcales bacterium]|nr:helix-hairpin-helix domain-containing protein [Polyangiaceae bacterium]MDW8248223.1 helix-hairpin-helix domain-containing protein [Myxococcales bacterium]